MKIDELIELLEGGSKRGNKYDDYLMHKAADVIKELTTGKCVGREWIPTKKRYPFAEHGEGDVVLTVGIWGVMRVLYFDGGNWRWPTGEPLLTATKFPITHWMPLPEEPKNT